MFRVICCISSSLLAVLLVACELPKQTISTKHIISAPVESAAAALPPPSLRPVRLPAMPPAPVPRPAQEVFSVVVSDVPVKTLLFALARDNQLNVDIHPSIGGRVTLNATDQTLSQLLERIASQSDIRYEIHGNLLRVQPDTPYIVNYTIDYVNLQRQSSSNVSVSSSLSSSGGANAGGSDASIKSTADNQFWNTLISNICQIVVSSNQNRNQRDEQIELQRQQEREDRLKVALELTKALQSGQGAAAGVGGNISGGAADLMRQVMDGPRNSTASGVPNDSSMFAPAGQAAASNSPARGNTSTSLSGVNPSALQSGAGVGPNVTGQLTNNGQSNTATTSCAAGAMSSGGSGMGASSSSVTNPLMVNKESGVIAAQTTSKGHQLVRTFIDKVMASARRQVLIEATVVEVQLSAASQSGINWSQLVTKGAANGLTIGLGGSASGFVNSATVSGNALSAIYAGTNAMGSIAAAINLLESFGQTKVLSSPKLSVINNQTAIIKVVDDYVYVTISYTAPTLNSSGGITSPATYTSTINTIPVGFVMTVTPQISDTGDVTLNVHPSITRVTKTIVDPNPALLNSTPPITNLIPVVQTREMESVLRVQSGEIAVLGGLMQESNVGTGQGIPGINRVEGLGAALGGQRSESRLKTELIVFMRPVVIKDASITGDYKTYKSQLPSNSFFNGSASQAWGDQK